MCALALKGVCAKAAPTISLKLHIATPTPLLCGYAALITQLLLSQCLL